MKAVEKVEAHIADALKKGAKVVTGGKRAAQGGSFFEPTVLTDVTTDTVITKEETFGAVAPLYRFKSEEDAVKMANTTLPSSARGGGLGRGSPPISTAATSAASGALPRLSNTASSASTKASSRRYPGGEIAPCGGVKESGIGPTRWLAHNDKRISGFQQGRCGCRSLRDAANLENEHAGACDFDYDRKDGEQRLRRQLCSRKPKRCEQGIADHRYNERARRCRAEPTEATKLLTISGMELRGNTTAADIRPAPYPDDDRKPECVTVDRAHDPTDCPYIVTDGTPHRGIPRDAGLHRDENTGDYQNDGDACSPSASQARPWRTEPR
jgi:hypothetical protein